MTPKRFIRISNPVTPAPLVFSDKVGTKQFIRISNPVVVVPLVMSRPHELTLEVELADPSSAAADWKNVLPLYAAVDRLERSFGGDGFDVDRVTPDGPRVTLVLRPVQADGAAERLARVREAVGDAIPPGFRVRRAG